MKLILSIFALMLATGAAFAQSDTATLVGRVTDSTTAVVPGATVEVRNVATDARRTVSTNKQGDYSITDLTPDTYDVTVTKPGFQKTLEPAIVLQTAQTARFDVTLVVGSVEQTVTVTTEVGALNLDTSDKGDVISPVEISEMPLDGRDFNDLVFNVAGVAPAEENSKGSAFVANGVRSDQTNIMVDGVNNTNPRDATAEATPPLDSLQEFKVQTSGYDAQYGRVAGPVVNLTIKKGGNSLKGSIFEYVRNDRFDAGNYFDVPGTHSELRRNQFGATVGGPIYIPHLYNGHDKMFFLSSWESYRSVAGSNSIGIVPSLLERGLAPDGVTLLSNADFSQSFNSTTGVAFTAPVPTPTGLINPHTGAPLLPNPNAIIPSFPGGYPSLLPRSAFDPTALQLMNQFYPLPTPQIQLPGANNYIVNAKSYEFWDNVLVKIDRQLAAHDEASVSYAFRRSNKTNPFSGSGLPYWGANTQNHQSIITVQETHIFTPALINNFKSGLTRQESNETPFDAGVPWANLLGIPGGTTDPTLVQFPGFNPAGYLGFGDSSSNPVRYTTNNYNTNDTVTWSKGKHTIKFGGEWLRVQYIQQTNSGFNGTISFSGKTTGAKNSFLEFLAGAPTSGSLTIGNVKNHIFDNSYGGFVQDDFKALPGLTLNLGMRYELETLPYEENNQFTSFVPALGEVVIAAHETPALDAIIAAVPGAGPNLGFADQLGYPRTIITPNHNRLAPRVGFALRPSLNDQLVIRGGYGIFYTGSRLSAIRTELAGGFPFSVKQSNCSTSSIQTTFTGCRNSYSTATGYDPKAPSSYVQSYNLTIERTLPKGMAMELGYTGSKGTHIGRLYDINQMNPAYCTPTDTTCRLYPAYFSTINFFSFNGYSNYNAATATLRKRFEHGLLFRTSFTWARSLDLASGLNYAGAGGYSGAQDSANPTAEYGRSDSDRKFVLNGNFVYLLPFHRNILVSGWESAGSFQVDSGTPLTPQLGGPTGDKGYADRPNRVCNGALAHPSVNMWFDTSCFPQVTANLFGVFGNSGRNIITGPKLVVVDLSFSRNFRITERSKLQFRAEVFNVPNHPNFNAPNDTLDSANAGTITKAKDPRVIQVAGKYSF